MPGRRSRALVAALLATLAVAAPASAQDPQLEQAMEEAGPLSTPIAQLDTPVGRVALERAELLSARFDQPIRVTLTTDRAVDKGTVRVGIPARWRTTPTSGIRASRVPRAPRKQGRVKGAHVGSATTSADLVLDGAPAGTEITAEIRDTGIPASTYDLPVSYTDAAGHTRDLGRLQIRLYAPVREAAETPWDDLKAVNVSSVAGSQSETFITVVPGNANRVLASGNSGPGGYGAWISANGGTSWTYRIVPTTADDSGNTTVNLVPCCDPMSAADSAGNIWYGGLANGAAKRIHVSRIAAGTDTFVNTVALDARTAGTQDKPLMTIDNNPASPAYGRLYVVWDEPNAGVNVVISQCDTRILPAGTLNAANCDDADNWTTPVTINKGGAGNYIYADVATGPDGKVYVVWWDYSNNNAIVGATCTANCATTGGWTAATNVGALDATGGSPIPFACPIPAQPGGRASTGSNIEVDNSGTATNGRVWVAWSDLRAGSGTTKCGDNGTTALSTNMTWDSIAKTAAGALPTTASPSIKLLTDGEGAGQSNSDDWFPWITVDQTTGIAYADFYSTRDDATRHSTNFYVRAVGPTGGLGNLTKVSTGATDLSANTCCTFGNDYGDYTGIDATSGFVFPVWTDKSTGNVEVFADKLAVSPPVASPLLTPGAATMAETPGSSDGDGRLEPGEMFDVQIPIANSGSAAATSTVGTLSSADAKVTFPTAVANYGTINNGTTSAPGTYRVHLDPSIGCGVTIPLHLGVTYTGGSVAKDYAKLLGGLASSDVPKSITDNNATGVNSTITVPSGGSIDDLDVAVDVTHPFVGDLTIKLKHPDNTVVTLTTRAGDPNYNGDDLIGTVFDDEAATAFNVADAPFTGHFKPEQPLTGFDGKAFAGTWTLTVSDNASGDVGSLNNWALIRPCVDPNVAPTAAISGPGSAKTGQSVTFSAAGSADADGTIASYKWDLDGNGSHETTTSANSAATSFASPGTYAVKVIAVDDDGAESPAAQASISVTAPVVVNPTPTPIATATATPKPIVNVPAPVASLLSSGAIKAIKDVFSVPVVGCANCKVVLVVKTAKKVAVKRGGKKKIVQLAKVSLTLDAKGEGKARFKLSRANRALLKRLKKIPAVATLTVTNTAGKTAVSTGRFTIKK